MYIKNGIIKKRNQIILHIGNSNIHNPSEELLLENGWEVYTPPIIEPEPVDKEQQYKDMIISLIRNRYSIDDELAILRQRDIKNEEFNEYNEYVESCKIQAYKEIYEI